MADDICEHKQVEAALRKSELRFRTLIGAVSAVTWACPPSGLHVEPHPEWMEFTGQTAEEMLGDGWTNAVHPEDLDAAVCKWEEAAARGEQFASETRIRRHDGQWRWMSVWGAPIRDASGEIVEWFGMNIDVTERKQAEAALRESEERLRLALDALREADRRKDEFLATLAHELRNPLAPIVNGLQILQLGSVDAAKAQRVRDMLARQINHLMRLVDDLLEASRANRGLIELRKERIDLAQAVNDAVAAGQPLIAELGHRLTISLPAEPLLLNADPTRLAQVLTNLLNNAAKFTEPGGRIEIWARPEDRDVLISVRDNGIGIPEGKLGHVFDLFTQIDTGFDHSRGGLGIGLALVRSLVELHGGRVEVHSEGAGLGSEFVVRLPLTDSRVAATPEGTEIGIAKPGSARRVLVVDDHRDVADSLALLLGTLDADVRVAYDGQSALEIVPAFKPEVVFLDLGMSKMNGYETARRLRRLPDGRGSLLVALTGWGQEDYRRQSLEAGFDKHLVKPADLGVLKALLAGGR